MQTFARESKDALGNSFFRKMGLYFLYISRSICNQASYPWWNKSTMKLQTRQGSTLARRAPFQSLLQLLSPLTISASSSPPNPRPSRCPTYCSNPFLTSALLLLGGRVGKWETSKKSRHRQDWCHTDS